MNIMVLLFFFLLVGSLVYQLGCAPLVLVVFEYVVSIAD